MTARGREGVSRGGGARARGGEPRAPATSERRARGSGEAQSLSIVRQSRSGSLVLHVRKRNIERDVTAGKQAVLTETEPRAQDRKVTRSTHARWRSRADPLQRRVAHYYCHPAHTGRAARRGCSSSGPRAGETKRRRRRRRAAMAATTTLARPRSRPQHNSSSRPRRGATAATAATWRGPLTTTRAQRLPAAVAPAA